jgi:Cdc6-like AAA superfamily ATPase
MGFIQAMLSFWSTVVGSASGLKDLKNFLSGRAKLEVEISKMVDGVFKQQMPRLQHLCPDGEPVFNQSEFTERLRNERFTIKQTSDLASVLIPHLIACTSTPGATCSEEDFTPIFHSILDNAMRGMWRRISNLPSISSEILLANSEEIHGEIKASQSDAGKRFNEIDQRITNLDESIKALADFAEAAWSQVYDKLLDSAPPPVHTIDSEEYQNPFAEVRAEDFNHNFHKLAKLFHSSLEWETIQSRTDNVFIEGGRGTGKSMLLRRLTAQASIAAIRLKESRATYEDLHIDYFGVYVKLTRGYYDRFNSIDIMEKSASFLLAQHELNIEIMDSFVATIEWLIKENAFLSIQSILPRLSRELGSLLSTETNHQSLHDLKNTIRFEQDQINEYYRRRAFGSAADYRGAAVESVTFLRRLSETFRHWLFPNREIRLFVLLDEFESLLEIQQVALNTVIKMRLPDLTLKFAVRKNGRKTYNTFTPGDPIQEPRDYTIVRFDYDINSKHYAQLLKGIASKRLEASNYPINDIDKYLVESHTNKEASKEDIDLEISKIWDSGNRRNIKINEEFKEKYRMAAIYRILHKGQRRKSFSGFENYVILSSGIVSNFIELCKYAFYFALSDQLPLRNIPQIPSYNQTEAVYRVSQRLLNTIQSNVPVYGSVLYRLVVDLGTILNNRLINHPSEPEANRLTVDDWVEIPKPDFSVLDNVIKEAVTWSVFHMEPEPEAYRPRNYLRAARPEIIINRIYSPALRISPRARWRINISLKDIKDLISEDSKIRQAAFEKLTTNIGFVKYSSESVLQMKLFKNEVEEQYDGRF